VTSRIGFSLVVAHRARTNMKYAVRTPQGGMDVFCAIQDSSISP
jgi:hypothetical protein